MKLRYLAAIAWALAIAFIIFIRPSLEADQFQNLVQNNQTIRVQAQVVSATRQATGFAGSTENQVEIRISKPDYLANRMGLLNSRKHELEQGQLIDAVLTFRKSNRTDYDFKASVKSLIGESSPESIDFFSNLRRAFSNTTRGVSADAAALVSGLAIGDDSKLSRQTKENFKAVSLTHLTAVSGANCAIVLALVALIINRLPLKRWNRVLVSLFAIAGYLALVGPEPSVLRASAMVAIVLVGFNLGRRVNPIDALALSIILLLVLDPKLSLDYGFALSVFATFGLLVLAPKLAEKLERRMPRWLALSLAVTVAAQVACLPILLVLQPSVPVYSVLANLLAEPLVVPITILGLLSCITALLLPPLSSALSFIASVPASWVILIAENLADAPYANLPWYSGVFGILVAILLTLAVFIWFLNGSKKGKLLSSLAITVIIAGFLAQTSATVVSKASFYAASHEIVNCDVGQGDALVIRSAGKTALIDVGRENPAIDQCLSGMGINQIDLLVLTHFDMDHVGGILGAVSGRILGAVLISPFEDNRPGADFAEQIVKANGGKLIPAEKDMHGALGNFSWRVLAPHRDATEAKDSNDASIAMLWESPNLVLFTLADLGEPGQLRIGKEQQGLLTSNFSGKPVVVKVAHHGSADQSAEFYEAIKPDLAIISVGQQNSYGHPTRRTLELLARLGTKVLRTDQQGALGISASETGLTATISGRS